MEMVKSVHAGKPYVWVLTELPPRLHKALRVAAAEQEITLKSMLRLALMDFAERRGLLPAKAEADRPGVQA
jgi:hypothetical protein